MPIDWKPHTTRPPERRATVLIAYGPELGVDNGFIGRVYEACLGNIVCGQTGRSPNEPFWWAYEHEVLDGIPGVKQP